MKLITLLAILALPIVAYSQIPKDEYETVTTEDPLASSYGKKFPGFYLNKDGSQVDCLILFEIGDKMSEMSSNLSTAMAYDGDVTLVDKRNLKAFFVNDRLYAPVLVDGVKKWGHYKTQGAIHLVMVPKYNEARIEKGIGAYYDEEKQTNVAYTDTIKLYQPYWSEVEYTQKLNNNAEIYPMISRKNMVKLVSDYPELATKIDNKEKGYKSSLNLIPGQEPWYSRMYTIYNQWYDEQNLGAIEYYPTKATYSAPAPVASANSTASAYEKEVIEAIEKAYFAPRVDPFEGRSTQVDPSVASAKPEVAVKKESFKERLNRIKADGNRVGVLVTSKNTVINPNALSDQLVPATVKGLGDPLSGLDRLAAETAASLNAGFGVDIFEAVDYGKIPYKEGKYGKLDDWWSTKYKVIVLYELKPFYNAFYRTNASNGEREYVAYERVNSELILMAAEDEKPDKLRYVIGSPRSMGSFISQDYIGPKETDFNIIQELKAAINPPTDDEIIKELIKNQQQPLAKLIKKLSK